MANYRAVSAGRVEEVGGRGRISVERPALPFDDGGAFKAASAAFGDLSGQLGAMAERAAIGEAERAGTAAGTERGEAWLARAPMEVRTGAPLDSGLVDRIVGAESGGRADAKAEGSTATGAAQFVEGTWLEVIGRHRPDLVAGKSRADVLALRTDPKLAREMAGAYVGELKDTLSAHGITPTAGALYLAYFLGPGDAPKVLKADGSAPVADLVSAGSIAANPAVFGSIRTASDLTAWADRKMGGRAAPAPEGAAPLADPPPLALRRDGTAAGAAYDEAAAKAFVWRQSAALDSEIAAAYDAHKDDPEALNRRLQEIRGRYVDAQLDPDLREASARAFGEAARPFVRKAAADLERAQKADATAAADEAFEASRLSLERQAYVIGANPAGDKDLDAALARAAAGVDAALEAGVLSPDQAADRRRALVETGALARVRGVFDATEDLSARERFASGLMDEWAAGKGPISALDYSKVAALQREFAGQVAEEKRAKTAAAAADRAAMTRALDDDVASLRSTGQPLRTDAGELDPARVGALLGPERALAWTAAREAARRYHATTADFSTIPDDEIERRLAALSPAAGSAGFAAMEELAAEAERRGRAIIETRRRDPAAAVDEAFPALGDAKAALDPARPETYARLASERLAAQAALDIPEAARQPLTQAEATAIVREISADPDPLQALKRVAGDVAVRYGPLADEVLVQVAATSGMDRDMAPAAARLIREMGLGRPLAAADTRALDAAGTAAAADRAVSGDMPPPPRLLAVPKQQAIDMIVADPKLDADFDRTFGAGAAAYFRWQRADRQRRDAILAEEYAR